MKQLGLGSLASGAITGPTPGRADAVPADVEEQSYVIPADVVSALGEGNTTAGHQVLKSLFQPKAFKAIPRPMKRGGSVAVAVSDGEHILSPAEVQAAGGPQVLDRFVKDIRAAYRKHLSKLPGPKK